MDEEGLKDWVSKLGVSPETIYVVGVIGEFIAKWYSEIQKSEEEKMEWEEEKMEVYMDKFDSIEKRLQGIESRLSPTEKRASVVLIEELGYKEAKKRVEDFIKGKNKTDIAEIHQALGIDIKTLVQILDDLKEAQRIEEG